MGLRCANSLQEVGGGEGLHVVGGGHGLAIGAGRADGNEVATTGKGQGVVAGEDVAGLADGPDDVIEFMFVGDACEVLHLVMCLVKRRADEVGHAGIEDDEALVAIVLDIENPTDE